MAYAADGSWLAGGPEWRGDCGDAGGGDAGNVCGTCCGLFVVGHPCPAAACRPRIRSLPRSRCVSREIVACSRV